jgi:hypothetical protein
MGKIGAALADQLDRLWASVREAIENCPDDAWRKGDRPAGTPVRLACHLIGGIDFYAGDKPDGFVNGHRWGGINWEKGGIDALPDRETLLAIQAEVQQYASEQLRALSDEALLDGENLFPWTGANSLERVIYMIRHSQQHLGEFNNELTRRGHKPAEWR